MTFPFQLASAEPSPLRIHFLNVGYADSILVELPDGRIVLIDGGDLDDGARLSDYLKAHRVRNIDALIITHPHVNHFGGLFAILEEIPIQRVFVNGDTRVEEPYFELLELIELRDVPIRTLKQGDQIENLPEEVQLSVLHPRTFTEDANNNSLVLKLSYGNTSFLLTADIGPTVQEDLIKQDAERLAADVIQIPHHGGPISTAFSEAFSDVTFLISTGKNEWALPRADELNKLKGDILRTDRDGTILLESDGQNVTILTKRESTYDTP